MFACPLKSSRTESHSPSPWKQTGWLHFPTTCYTYICCTFTISL